MSITSIISSASAALLKTQTSISVANSNVSNADNTSYTRKSFSGSLNSSTTALTSGALTRAADAYLSKTALTSTSAASRADTINTYLQNYEVAIGGVDSGDDLSSLIDSFTTSLSNLSASPSSASAQSGVVSSASDLANTIKSTSTTVQNLRSQANSDLAGAVSDINSLLSTVSNLNDQIVTANASNDDATSLLDARDAALASLSELTSISTYTQSDGRTIVYSQGGDLLVGTQAATLSFKSSGSLSASSTYPGTISGIMLNGQDVTASLSGGKIGALVELRDDTLPAQQDKLDALASTLIETMNAISNQGASYPAPSSLSSAEDVSGADSFSASGTARVAVLDANGSVVSSTDLDLSAYSSMDDLVSALDAIDGVSASISNEKLTISADDSANGVAIGALDSAIGSNSKNFSAYFGFNNLFSGSDASSIAVSARLAENPSLLPALSLNSATSLNAGDVGLAVSDSSFAESLNNALSQQRSFTVGSSTTKASLADFASNFVSEAATMISNADSQATQTATTRDTVQSKLTNLTGVNLDEETAKLTQLQTQYQATAQLVSLAREMFNTLLEMVQ